jgi:hypothetical protein
LSLSLLKKLGHIEGELKCTSLSLSGFAGDPTEVKGIICKELTDGNKTVHMTFFMVDVKGRYNMLLSQDWIHANGCVSSTLRQCVIQWIGDEVEVVQADEDVCIIVAKSQVDIQEGIMKCLTGMDLMGYYYVSIGKDEFVRISVKPAIGATRLAHDLVQMVAINRDLEWLNRQTLEYCSSTDNAIGAVEDLHELGKLCRGFSSMDDLEEIDIGDGVVPWPTYVSAHLDVNRKHEIIELLKAYKCCFAWDYTEMPGLSRELVKHRLPIKASFTPYKQGA